MRALALALLFACGANTTSSPAPGDAGSPPLGSDGGPPDSGGADSGEASDAGPLDGGGTPDAGTADGGGGGDAGAPDGGGPVRFGLNVTVNGQGSVASMPFGIDCGPTCSAEFDAGTSVSLIPNPAAGWTFDGWGGACAGSSACAVVVSAAQHVSARFVRIPPIHMLSLTVAGGGAGRVTSQPAGVDCTTTCRSSFAEGITIVLTSTSKSGSAFHGWAGACAGVASCTVTLATDIEVSAEFALVPTSRSAYTIAEIASAEIIADLTPASINRAGDVVGYYRVSLYASHSFLYEAATSTTRRIGADATDSQIANAINAIGQVAISTDVSTPSQARGYRWQGGLETSIGSLPPDGPHTSAIAINEAGWIAGWSQNSEYWQRAVMWDGTVLHDLGSLAETSSMAWALNDHGVAVGDTEVSDQPYPRAAAFMAGAVRDLGQLGDTGSVAYGINNSGRIVGMSPAPGGRVFHAFVFDLPNGPMRDVSPSEPCMLYAVNEGGDAVGQCSPADHVDHAAIWQNGAFVDLNDVVGDPSWVLVKARAINASGQIAGTGMHNGEPRAFVLTPRR